jgi:hypothetical protein
MIVRKKKKKKLCDLFAARCGGGGAGGSGEGVAESRRKELLQVTIDSTNESKKHNVNAERAKEKNPSSCLATQNYYKLYFFFFPLAFFPPLATPPRAFHPR